MSPKVLEAWFTLMAEAMKGTNEAKEAFQLLSDMSSTPEEFNRWIARFMPAAASAANFRPDQFDNQLEDWWRMMGMVPRSRYLELLEKYDAAQRKLEKAEETINNLRKRGGGSAAQAPEEAKKVMNVWGSMMAESLKTQADWVQMWTGPEKEEAAKKKNGDSQEEPIPDETNGA